MKRLFVLAVLFFVQLGAMKRSETESSFGGNRNSCDLKRSFLGEPRSFQIPPDSVIGKSALGNIIKYNVICVEFRGCGHVFTEEEIRQIVSKYNVPLVMATSRCSLCYPFNFRGLLTKYCSDCALFMGWKTARKND